MSERKEYTIGEICSRFSSGKSIKASQISAEGLYPVYGGNGLRGFTDTFNFDGECSIIGRQGAYCGNVRYFKGKAFMTEHAIVAVVNENHNNGYVSNLLSMMNLAQYQGQSAQPGLSVSTLSKITIKLPDLATQEQCFNVLNLIDQKIQINNQINQELEAMAKTLYDYWFVQFDFPDQNGKPYKSSGGKMVYHPELKREIPEGWGVEKLSYFLTIKNGKDHKHLQDGKFAVYGSGGIMRMVTDYLYSGESILFPRKGTLNNVMYVNEKFWTVDTMFYSEVNKNNSALYVFYSVKDIDFNKLNTGTGVPSMTSSILYDLNIIVPEENILEKFNTVVKRNYETIKLNNIQNQELIQLRDWLLPMLMNGQVKVEKSSCR